MSRRTSEYIFWLVLLSTVLVVVLRQPKGMQGQLLPEPVPIAVLKHSNEPVEAAPIRQISVLGERNSGTRWTFDHISACFGHALPVEKQLTRYKHWFQYPAPERYPHDTLVLAQFRNPYDWLKAMERVPHHAPAHFRLKAGADLEKQDSQNDWRLFLTKPWTMERFGADLDWDESQMCQENFHYKDLVSCVKEPQPHSFYNHTLRYSEHQPFYEMKNDGSGEPYANIMEMRTDKIRNFLSVADYEGVAALWVVQYEYLLSRGTQHLINRIAEWTGVRPQCQAKPPQARLQKKSRVLSVEFSRFVRLNLNWTVERMIGYEPDERREAAPREW